jgi:hypothetical protein
LATLLQLSRHFGFAIGGNDLDAIKISFRFIIKGCCLLLRFCFRCVCNRSLILASSSSCRKTSNWTW